MRSLLLTAALLLPFTTFATTTSTATTSLSKGLEMVANRLATKSLSEVVTLAMKLQLECQQEKSLDVCGGVKSILAVLDARIENLPQDNDNTKLAFVKGLMDGVNSANLKTLQSINRLN